MNGEKKSGKPPKFFQFALGWLIALVMMAGLGGLIGSEIMHDQWRSTRAAGSAAQARLKPEFKILRAAVLGVSPSWKSSLDRFVRTVDFAESSAALREALGPPDKQVSRALSPNAVEETWTLEGARAHTGYRIKVVLGLSKDKFYYFHSWQLGDRPPISDTSKMSYAGFRRSSYWTSRLRIATVIGVVLGAFSLVAGWWAVMVRRRMQRAELGGVQVTLPHEVVESLERKK